jgi:hypothetical protein
VVLEGNGLRIELPAGWYGQSVLRSPHLPTLQGASFPLDPGDEELGPGSRAAMTPGDCFLALIQYLPGSGVVAGRVPFHEVGLSLPLDPNWFSAEVEGRAVMERNFSAGGRAFCLHVAVAGSRLDRRRRLPLLDRVLGSLTVQERSAGLTEGAGAEGWFP